MAIFVGALYMGIALILYLFPPKKINGFYGYRTKRSKTNKKMWAFAQKRSSSLILIFAFFTFAFSCVFHEEQHELWVVAIMISTLLLAIVLTEMALKKKLDK